MVAKDPIFFGNSSKLLRSYFATLSESLQSWASQFFRKSCITQFFPQSSRTSFASLAEKARNPAQASQLLRNNFAIVAKSSARSSLIQNNREDDTVRMIIGRARAARGPRNIAGRVGPGCIQEIDSPTRTVYKSGSLRADIEKGFWAVHSDLTEHQESGPPTVAPARRAARVDPSFNRVISGQA
ncbi:uncharacterized protein PGTG_13322 [Puccinia graminis f. sp. tritici CRL 75-36-700-3]|uniref:Uncharacterized protein n=1 Tax=Puccinia graminis f. sp. tritici (strain CRL 75-36-700-3 / race SCCL) TaxID=418459 RepID=E3KS28_PUCGT|nr:uncharacterized protein PGTG_13322 [Puccinia graminis f. sp. tritici CRL 75-36-700-3]EFP87103.2 hypothetical protein PGTG_13322 [Puccinia graminis f. sp. tritici CRL 75-36-700-3]